MWKLIAVALVVGLSQVGCVVAFTSEDYGEYSEVMGFGTSPSKAEAQRLAWDDAIARINAMGIRHFRVQPVHPTADDIRQNGNAHYEATIRLAVWDIPAPPPTTQPLAQRDHGATGRELPGEQ